MILAPNQARDLYATPVGLTAKWRGCYSPAMPIKKDTEAYNAYMRDYMQRRYHKRRALALEFLGNRCVICRAAENLHIDHFDPKTKGGGFEDIYPLSLVKFYAELKKCQLLCEKCHQAKTVREGSYRRGENNSQHKLTAAAVMEIRRRHGSELPEDSTQAMAAQFGVAKTTILLAATGKTWKADIACYRK